MQRKLYLESRPMVLNPELCITIDVFPCEDGHAQERSLFESVLHTVKAGQLWIAAICVPKGFSLVYLQLLLTF